LIDIKESKSKKRRPVGLNTVNLLKFVTKNMGLGSHDAMKAAEKLYLSGYVTYPRTESTQYPKNFDFKFIANKIASDYGSSQYATHAKNLIQ